jgi:transcriptional regulator with XRE-family HTH domain
MPFTMLITNVELLKLGFRIKALRKLLGRNQKDVFKRCGLDRSYFDAVERGQRSLTFADLCQICAGLELFQCSFVVSLALFSELFPYFFRQIDLAPGYGKGWSKQRSSSNC